MVMVYGLAGAEGGVLLIVVSQGGANFLSFVCLSVQRAAGRNFFSILDCKPILESSPNYLEVLFFLFRSFYFLRFLTFWLFFSKSQKMQIWVIFRYMSCFSDICHVTYQMKANFMANSTAKKYLTKNVILDQFLTFWFF